MASTEQDIKRIELADNELWQDGPPYEVFRELRAKCPVHWSERIEQYPTEAGFWSVTMADDVHAVSRDWQTYSSATGGVTVFAEIFPLELVQGMFIGMDPPRHDKVKALFQRGFTPKRIADHEERIRAIVRDVLDRLGDRETCDLVGDVAQPVVSRVIHSFMGTPPEDDALWARICNASMAPDDPDMAPEGIEGVLEKDLPELFARVRKMIADRTEKPTDDLTSVLVHAEVEGEKLNELEIVMGFFLLILAGNDSTKATYCSGMRALMEDPAQMRELVENPSLIPGAVEESLRMFPAFAVMWYVSSNRDESRYEDPDRFDVHRNPEHQAFGAGGRHFCLGTALARLELQIMIEETLARYPEIQLDGAPVAAEALFVNQLKSLPVRLGATSSAA